MSCRTYFTSLQRCLVINRQIIPHNKTNLAPGNTYYNGSIDSRIHTPRGTPSISEAKLLRPAIFCLLISCPPERAAIVNFAFVSFVNLYRPLLLPIELFHYERHRLKPLNSTENSCRNLPSAEMSTSSRFNSPSIK